jgi:hypothetical protein
VPIERKAGRTLYLLCPRCQEEIENSAVAAKTHLLDQHEITLGAKQLRAYVHSAYPPKNHVPTQLGKKLETDFRNRERETLRSKNTAETAKIARKHPSGALIGRTPIQDYKSGRSSGLWATPHKRKP